jgi:hypothetical protein
MKYISALLSHLRITQLLLPILLSAVLAFTTSCNAKTNETVTQPGMVQLNNAQRGLLPGAKSANGKGTVQLDQIEKKAEEAINSPARSLKTIEERSKGALNEVQGNAADQDKMNRSNDRKLPVVKQTEKALNKMKNG